MTTIPLALLGITCALVALMLVMSRTVHRLAEIRDLLREIRDDFRR